MRASGARQAQQSVPSARGTPNICPYCASLLSLARLSTEVSTYSQALKRRNLWEEIPVFGGKVSAYGTQKWPLRPIFHPGLPANDGRDAWHRNIGGFRHCSEKSPESIRERIFWRPCRGFRGEVFGNHVSVCLALFQSQACALTKLPALLQSFDLTVFYLSTGTGIGTVSRSAKRRSRAVNHGNPCIAPNVRRSSPTTLTLVRSAFESRTSSPLEEVESCKSSPTRRSPDGQTVR